MSMLPLLFVDDDRMAREMALAFFKREGLSIDVAESVAEAQEKIKTNYYKTVVSDLMLPVLDGMDFIEWLSPRYPRINFLFATNHGALEGYMETASKYKIYRGYCLKPLTPTRVKMALISKDDMINSAAILRFR